MKMNYRKINLFIKTTVGASIGCMVLLMGSTVSAAPTSIPIIFDPQATSDFADGITTNYGAPTVPATSSSITSLGSDNGYAVGVFRLDVEPLCQQYVNGVTIRVPVSANHILDSNDGATVSLISDPSNPASTIGSSITTTNGYPGVYNPLALSIGYGAPLPVSPDVSSATWTIASSVPLIYSSFVLEVNDAQNTTDSLTTLQPTAEVTYSDAGQCPNLVPTPSALTVSRTIANSEPEGSVVVSGSGLGVNDSNSDNLSYSITSGNGSNYFSINPDTGDIKTTQSNIPVGTYTLTIEVDDGRGGVVTVTVEIIVTDEGTSTSLAETGSSIFTMIAAISIVGLAILYNLWNIYKKY